MKKSQLAEMIRTIVAEEVRRQLPGVVSEMYLRKLVSEVNVPQTTSWENSFDAELQRRTEKVPEMMHTSDEGIYQQGGVVRRKNESRSIPSKLLASTMNVPSLYEGVKPISSQQPGSSAQPEAVTNVPLDNDFFNLTKGKYKNVDFNKSSMKPLKQSAETETRRLEMLRASLDVKA